MPPPHVTVAAPTSLKRAPTSPPHTCRYVWPIPMQLETTAPPVGTGQPSVLSPSIKLVAIKGGADKVTTSAMARYRSILVNQSRGGGGDTAADADGGGGGVQVNRVEIVVSDSFLTGARHRFVLSIYVSLSLNKKMVAMPCLDAVPTTGGGALVMTPGVCGRARRRQIGITTVTRHHARSSCAARQSHTLFFSATPTPLLSTPSSTPSLAYSPTHSQLLTHSHTLAGRPYHRLGRTRPQHELQLLSYSGCWCVVGSAQSFFTFRRRTRAGDTGSAVQSW